MLKDTTIQKMNLMGSQRKPFLFIIDYKAEKPIIIALDQVDPQRILYHFNNTTNAESLACKQQIIISGTTLSKAHYKEKFDQVMQQINLGNTYLTNLTTQTPVTLNATLDQVFHHTNAKYKLWVKDKFVCFSPEIFVQIKDDRIYSYPMKGTIDANQAHAAQKLLNDPKEKAEHYTIVDLIRNDLSIVAKNVEVDKFAYLDTLHTSKGSILQMSSQISGALDACWHQQIGDILAKLLPAGSITGAPKQSTIDIIENTEGYQRGYYTGICGLYDGKSLDSAVMIRFIEQQNKGFVYKSGGGITCGSNLQSEYEELSTKIYLPLTK